MPALHFFSFLGFVGAWGYKKCVSTFRVLGDAIAREAEILFLTVFHHTQECLGHWPVLFSLPSSRHQDEYQDSMETATSSLMQAVIMAMPWSEQLESADSQARSLDSKSCTALALAQLEMLLGNILNACQGLASEFQVSCSESESRVGTSASGALESLAP